MPGYHTKQETIAIAGENDLQIRSLLDLQQHADADGAAERLGISSAQWPLFGLLWPSGAHLAARMALRPVVLAERILEIGCGLGLASLVAHRRGADVTASDVHPMAAAFLLENLRLNQLPPMKYRHGPWALPVPPAVAGPDDLQGSFDLIIGSDVLYERDERGTLAAFIERHAAPVAEVWIVDPDRGNRPAFNRHMASHGYGLQELRLAHALPLGAGTRPHYKGRMLVYRRGLPVG
ncbi:class I SAM-dependent methyltransferase [Aquabacterium sp. OR-4]|uniref:class I SAM-dependent methyltransferase n=1 Tax=Aquabacterium sp. OR-4 TaxID=2978127 RepID=UPI0021B182B5|nr:class I SAM-dependent methyltransferase [Aquabacterium sp. OR-4]MDT7837198.1 class I SAM-dependent methyltransferase [Aquabacterium sp. OR-4]